MVSHSLSPAWLMAFVSHPSPASSKPSSALPQRVWGGCSHPAVPLFPSPALFLVRIFTRRRSTAVSVTGFRMCSAIYPGEFKISNYCHLHYRQDLLFLLPYKPEYNSIFEVHVLILALLQFLEQLTVLLNAWSIRNISWLFKILLENSYVTDLLIFSCSPFLLFILNVVFNYSVVYTVINKRWSTIIISFSFPMLFSVK